MSPKELQTLVDRYLDGTCSASERRLVDKFLESYSGENEIEGMGSLDMEAIKNEIYGRIRHDIHKEKPKAELGLKYWLRIAAVVMAGVVLSVTAFFIYQQYKTKAGVVLLTKTTQRGQRATIKLADGTVVQLNSESSLAYPEIFSDDHREVVLTGEAFFDVARNEDKPFIVVSSTVSTRVLGTSFNISAFPHEEIKVTVASGVVQVASSESESKEIVRPNQQATYDPSSGTFLKKEFDASIASEWKDGVLRLENVTLEEAASLLEQWYGVTISFQNDAIKSCVIRVRYRNETLANVLDGWKYLLGTEYEIKDGNQIILSGGGCGN